jgi:hypothetical protein
MSTYILFIYVWHTCNLVPCNKLRRHRERETCIYGGEVAARPGWCTAWSTTLIKPGGQKLPWLPNQTTPQSHGIVQNLLSAKTDALDVCMSWRRSYSTRFTNIIWTCTAAAFIPLKLHPKPNCIVLVTTTSSSCHEAYTLSFVTCMACDFCCMQIKFLRPFYVLRFIKFVRWLIVSRSPPYYSVTTTEIQWIWCQLCNILSFHWERKCHVCDFIVLNKLALTQSKRISEHDAAALLRIDTDCVCCCNFFEDFAWNLLIQRLTASCW